MVDLLDSSYKSNSDKMAFTLEEDSDQDGIADSVDECLFVP